MRITELRVAMSRLVWKADLCLVVISHPNLCRQLNVKIFEYKVPLICLEFGKPLLGSCDVLVNDSNEILQRDPSRTTASFLVVVSHICLLLLYRVALRCDVVAGLGWWGLNRRILAAVAADQR
jgi:hypothetical protein